jgi:hypothetical protein
MKQIVVVCEEQRPGLLADIAGALAEAGVNIESLDAETTRGVGAQGVVILTVDRYDDALAALRVAGFLAVTEDAILVRLENKPGALAEIAQRFKAAGINLRSVRFVFRNDEYALVALAADRSEDALALVRDVFVA